MAKKGGISKVDPLFAIAGGEISVYFDLAGNDPAEIECLLNGIPADISAVSTSKILARVPEGLKKEEVELCISVAGVESDPVLINVGKRLADKMHIVANPAVDPTDGSVILTRSGTRGQELPTTLFRLRNDEIFEMTAAVLNPTAVAFDSNGQLFVTNRADGEVLQVNSDSEVVALAAELGVATGIAFDSSGTMFVGDRNGTIYKLSALGDAREWAHIEASVSAFHMAFGSDDSLYVAAPGLCSHDVIHRIDRDGHTDVFFKGLGRPQGLAFDDRGNLYVAACLRGRHGIVRIDKDGLEANLWVAGMSIVGLCFDSRGRLLVATSDSLYGLEVDTYGTLV